MLKRGFAEFLGSFLFCTTVCMCTVSPIPASGALASGLVLAGMVYASAHLSGAHFNPLVSIAMLIRGKMQASLLPVYIISQFLCAATSGLIFLTMHSGKPLTGLDLSQLPLQAILAEFIGSFGLIYVTLNVASSRNTQGNNYYGLAIGVTYTALAMALGPISGGVFNPSLSLVLGITNISQFSNLWMLWLGQFAGGVMAAVSFLFLSGKE